MLYWYESTSAGARVAPGSVTLDAAAARCGYSLYLLYWYKSTNTDTWTGARSTQVCATLKGYEALSYWCMRP